MILFIDNYDSFTYNLVDYIGQMESDLKVIRNDQIDVSEIVKFNPQGIVISPGPGSPDDAGISCDIIRKYYQTIPILGICLGFQSLGQVFGGNIVRAPYPVHGKTSEILHNGIGIFNGITSPMRATRYHSLIIERSSLAEELNITAESEDGLVMAIEHRHYPVYGVQFHPESILTKDGMTLLQNWLSIIKYSTRKS